MASTEKLKALFPRGSADFFKANETKTRPQLHHPNSEQNKKAALDGAVPGKEKSLVRVTVRYRLRRVRPLDPDNAQGSTKDLTDGLCRCGLLPGDDPTKIILIVEQKKVEHYSDEGTDICLEWPED